MENKEILESVLKLLQNTHTVSQSILESQREEFIHSSDEAMRLYQSYWASNMKLENIADLLKIAIR